MTWFLLILIPPFLWSLVNHIDKYIIKRYSQKNNLGGLIIYSTLFVVIIIPIIFIINPHIFSINFVSILVLILAGLVISIGNILYFYALSIDETSAVVPFMQLIPVFAYFLGFIFLGEKISIQQMLAALTILVGAFIISLEFNVESGTKIKKAVLYFGLAFSFFFALYSLLFKVIAIKNDFWVSLFWEQIGVMLTGIILFCFVSKYRRDFIDFVKKNTRGVFFLNITNELLTDIGNVLFNFTILLAPLVLVNLAESYQSVLVFIEGIIFTKYFPKFVAEKMTTRDLVQKTIALVIIIIGSTWLLMS